VLNYCLIQYFIFHTLLQSGAVATQSVFTIATGIDGMLLQCLVVTSNFTSAGRKNNSHKHDDGSSPLLLFCIVVMGH
jgi:hypothetical protein